MALLTSTLRVCCYASGKRGCKMRCQREALLLLHLRLLLLQLHLLLQCYAVAVLQRGPAAAAIRQDGCQGMPAFATTCHILPQVEACNCQWCARHYLAP
jgi:hypothetical protein